jgi:CW_7 repeat
MIQSFGRHNEGEKMSITEPNEPGEPNVVVEPPTEPEPEEETKEEEEDDPDTENPLSEVALAVGRGEWGVGQERRRRLSEAGYDPREVQAEVVRLRNK